MHHHQDHHHHRQDHHHQDHHHLISNCNESGSICSAPVHHSRYQDSPCVVLRLVKYKYKDDKYKYINEQVQRQYKYINYLDRGANNRFCISLSCQRVLRFHQLDDFHLKHEMMMILKYLKHQMMMILRYLKHQIMMISH